MVGILSATILATVALSCVGFESSASSTRLSPKNQVAPLGEEFKLICRSPNLNGGGEYGSELYNLTASGARQAVPSSVAARCDDWSVSPGPGNRTTLTTTFTLTASEETAGQYGCLLLHPSVSHSGTFSLKDRRKEVTVQVCSEPELQLESSDSADPIVIRAAGRCYAGELTWVVNGRRAPRAAEATPSLPAVEKEDDTLEILGAATGCGASGAGGTCNATAIFTYIVNGRLRSVRKSQQVEGCCISGEFPAENIVDGRSEFAYMVTDDPEMSRVVYPPHPSDIFGARRQMETEKWALEKEVLSLQRDVLGFRKTALPLQIKFLRRLSKDHTNAREAEQVGDV